MKLEEVLSKELFEQVKAAIDEVNGKETDKLKHVRYADLSEGEYISKEKYRTLETDKSSVAEQLGKANELIEQLKTGTKADETLQGKIGDYKTTISTLTAENEKLKTESTLKVALLDAGAKVEDIDYLMYKAKEKGDVVIDENGKVKGQEELLSELKTKCPSQFTSAEQRRVQENKLEMGDNQHQTEEPKTLAEALKQQYEETAKNSNIN